LTSKDNKFKLFGRHGKISFGAQINSKQLMGFDGQRAVEDKELIVPMQEVIVPEVELTAFEKYFNCKPEQIILTREEENKWRNKNGANAEEVL
jgi:hypothetical protein